MNKRRIVTTALLPFVLGAEWLNIARPTLWTWAVFWALIFMVWGLAWREFPVARVVLAVMFAGIGMNALVTGLNGGYMPFLGNYPSGGHWVAAGPGHDRLLWLADRFGGWSLGDFFLIGSMALAAVIGTARAVRWIARGPAQGRAR